jgi:LuxR family transcriptional regulator, quorum-sensing system regulator BjaR1
MLRITPSEQMVLQLLAHGMRKHDIAVRLRLSEQEVDSDLAALCSRMGAASTTDAVAAALRRGLIRGDAHRDAELTQGRS